jgi:hypothetical protein
MRELTLSLVYVFELIRISHSLSKWRLLCSLNGHKDSPLMLTIESRILSYFEHVVKALFKNFFWEYVIGVILNCIPPKYRCLIKKEIGWGFSTLCHVTISPLCSTWGGATRNTLFLLHGLHFLKQRHFGQPLVLKVFHLTCYYIFAYMFWMVAHTWYLSPIHVFEIKIDQ